MKYEWLLIALYLIVLGVIATQFFNALAIAGVVVLLMIIVIVQKIGLESFVKNSIGESDRERNIKLDDMHGKIELIANKVDAYKDDFNRQIVFVDNKVSDVRHFVEVEVSNAYNDLSRKLSVIEDRVSELRQLFSTAVGSLDERIQITEQREEEDIF